MDRPPAFREPRLSRTFVRVVSALLSLLACSASAQTPTPTPGRVFRANFEKSHELRGFYVTPNRHMGTSLHARTKENPHGGLWSHKGWLIGPNPAPLAYTGDNNHRAYPTIQLQKLPGGGFVTPCLVDFWVWLETAPPGPLDWFSFATFSADPSPRWSRVVLLNLSPQGWVHLMHVPSQDQSVWDFQNKTLKMPLREWVHFVVYLDFRSVNGYAKAWMNGELVSAAPVTGGSGKLEQVHFGLYAPPTTTSATVYNDDIAIHENVPVQAP
jgi:hypothetical protein